MPEETAEQTQVEAPQSTTENGETAAATATEVAAADTAKLESSIASLLGQAFDAAPAVEVETAKDEEQPEGEKEVAAQTEEQEAQEAAATVKPVTVTDPNAPTLPAAFRRSLIARGYTENEIDADLKSQGTRFVEMAERVHRGRSAEIADWATAGRQAKAVQQQRQQPQQQQQVAPATGMLGKLDAAALKKEYGDDKLIDALVGPINAAIDRVNSSHEAVQKVQAKSQTAETETLIRQIDGFFGSADMKSFTGVYGDANFAKDQTKIEARNKVLEMADALITGAGFQGRSLTLGEALTMAHDALSGEYKTQAVRTQVRQQLQQRNNGITLKPAVRGNNPAGFNGSKNKTQEKVAGLLTKAFG